MAAEPARLLKLADAIAEGRDVDWAEAEATAGSADDREIIAQLRLLAGVADIHRHSGDVVDDDVPADPLIGTRWGGLEIRALIGAGSFGNVYRAYDPKLDRDVALKLLRASSAEDDVLSEGRLLAKVRHPHVVTVYGADRINGRVGIWMEDIQGRTLEEALSHDGPLGAREAAALGIDLCGALAAVHAEGLVHSDVKARNVMREDGGRIVLMDFGASRDVMAEAADESTVGTPLYMAPEVIQGGPATPQSDIYSLGVVLFRAVTGRFPVDGRTRAEVVAAHARRERLRIRDARPDLPPWFVAAVETALAADPRNRYATPAAFEAGLGVVPPTRRDTKTLVIAGGLVVALAAAGAASWSAGRWSTTPTAPVGVLSTIGVWPMKNLTGDSSQDFFAAGLTDVLVAHLGAIKALRVLPLADPQVKSASAELRLDTYLETSVQRNTGRVRVSARLVQGAGGTVLWGGNYDGADSEAFMLQGRIAADLARDLGVSVTDIESRRLTKRYVANPAAQNAYLHGRYLLDTVSRDNLERARVEFENAVRLDPDFAPAHASLASAYLDLAAVGALSPVEVRTLAISAAETAVAKDPYLAEAVLARAEVRHRLQWLWAEAETDYKAAIDLNPSDIRARARYSRFLAADERLDEALSQAREALSLDPLSADVHGIIGIVLYYRREYADAVEHFRQRDAERLPNRVGLGRALAGLGRFSEAVAELEVAHQQSGGDPASLAELARTWAAAGQPEKARAALMTLEDLRSRTYVSAQDLAYIHVALGEHARAFDLLFEAVESRNSRLLFLAVDPRVEALKGDSRFNELMLRLGRHQ